MTTGLRKQETMCPQCGRIAGVRPVWNETWSKNPTSVRAPVWKMSRHHTPQSRWCIGSGMSVPAGAVVPVPDGKVS